MDAFLCACATFRFMCQSTDLSEYHLCPNLHLNGGSLIWSERGTGTAGASFFFSPQLCPYLVYGRKTISFSAVLTSPSPFLGCTLSTSYSVSPPPSEQLWSRHFISSIFRNVCRVGVFSQGCLSSHINVGAFADTERAIVREEERMSGMTLHFAVMEYLVSLHGESCCRAVVQTLTASCKN